MITIIDFFINYYFLETDLTVKSSNKNICYDK